MITIRGESRARTAWKILGSFSPLFLLLFFCRGSHTPLPKSWRPSLQRLALPESLQHRKRRDRLEGRHLVSGVHDGGEPAWAQMSRRRAIAAHRHKHTVTSITRSHITQFRTPSQHTCTAHSHSTQSKQGRGSPKVFAGAAKGNRVTHDHSSRAVGAVTIRHPRVPLVRDGEPEVLKA